MFALAARHLAAQADNCRNLDVCLRLSSMVSPILPKSSGTALSTRKKKRRDLLTPRHRHWYASTGTLSGTPIGACLEQCPAVEIPGRGHRFDLCHLVDSAGHEAAIASSGPDTWVPVHITEGISRLNRTMRLVEQEQEDGGSTEGRDTEHVIPAANLPSSKVVEMVKMVAQPLSLERTVGEDNDASLAEAVEDTDAVLPAAAAENSMLRDRLVMLVGSLPERERKVIDLRYGLSDGRPRTLKEVSGAFGLTRERIRQLETAALSHLREVGEEGGLREYLN